MFGKWFGGSTAEKKVEAPDSAPVEPEAKREEHKSPELSVIEGGNEGAEADAGDSQSKFWLVQGEKAAQGAVRRFEAANNFFRQLKKEGKAESAKWDKESARYLGWMEAIAQVDCARRLKNECESLEKLDESYLALPDMPLLTASERSKKQLSYSFDQAVANMKEQSRISSLMRTQAQFVESLQVQFAEHQLKMEEYDSEVAKEDATLAENKEREAKRQEVLNAHAELEAAQEALAAKTDGFLSKFRNFSVIFRTKEQKEANARLDAAKQANPDKLMDEFYDRFAMGKTNAASKALANYKERQAKYEADMRHAGGLW